MAATYEPIATTTLGSAASSITFSSIPSTYTDLEVVLVCKSDASGGSAAINIQFNSDTATNYSQTMLYGNGSAAGSQRGSGNSNIEATFGAPSTTLPMLFTMSVMSYAGSTDKTALCSEANDNNGSGSTSKTVGLWRSTSSITSIKLWMNSAGRYFAAGTTATLYGIKSA